MDNLHLHLPVESKGTGVLKNILKSHRNILILSPHIRINTFYKMSPAERLHHLGDSVVTSVRLKVMGRLFSPS